MVSKEAAEIICIMLKVWLRSVLSSTTPQHFSALITAWRCGGRKTDTMSFYKLTAYYRKLRMGQNLRQVKVLGLYL